MSEASLWDWLSKKLPAWGHFTRIESETSAGFPDVHYTIEHHTGTMELKDSRNPESSHPFNSKNGLRSSQITWINEELDAGGVVWIVAQVDRIVYFLPGHVALLFNELDHSRLENLAKLIIYKGTMQAGRIEELINSLLTKYQK